MTKPILELIERLEKATEGSRKLDDAIFAAAHDYHHVSGSGTRGGLIEEDFWLTGAPDNVIGGQVLLGPSPMYTHDINAARTLVESGLLFSVEGNASDYQEGRYGEARVWCSPEYSKIPSLAKIDVKARAATPALALCIAALRARLGKDGEK